MSKPSVVLNNKFRRIAEVSPDERKRISLAKAMDALKAALGDTDALRFAVYVNDAGQVLLSPEVSVPLREAWLYRNPEVLKSIARGLTEIAKPKSLLDLGSFEKHADDEID
jgi:hypothetical protein